MNHKLEYFSATIAREVEARRRRAKHRLANDFAKETAKVVEAAEEKARERTEKARNECRRKANQKITNVYTEEKGRHFARRKLHQAKTLEAVRGELVSFAESADYEWYLIARITAAKAEPFTVVRLRAEDMAHVRRIEDVTGLTAAEADESDLIGGFILESEDGRVRADYTFKTRLEEVDYGF